MSIDKEKLTNNDDNQALKQKIDQINWASEMYFEAYGTRIGVRFNTAEAIESFREMLPNSLPNGWNEIEYSAADFIFSVIIQKRRSGENIIYKNGEPISTGFSSENLWEFIDSQIRMTVGEYSKEFVFIHAGAVGWKGKAIIFPGSSYYGKSTLTAEFVKRGALYYSDDFTVLDKNGYVHPFLRKISLRGIIDDHRQKDFDVEELGGTRGADPIPVGALLLTKYKKDAKPKLKQVSQGEAIMAGVENSLSVRQNPAQVLSVLTKALEKAQIYKSNRNEAGEFVEICLNLFDW